MSAARGGIDAASLRRAIGERKLGDWVITDRTRRQAGISLAGAQPRWRTEERTDVRVLVRRDLPAGRGTGVAWTQERSGDPRALIGQAVARAEAAIEPPWATPPPAAIAKVAVDDERVTADEAGAQALALTLQSAAAGAGARLLAYRATVTRDELALVSASGLQLTWRETALEVWASVERDGRRGAVRRLARRADELSLPATLAALVAELSARGAPAPPPRGPVLLELAPEAMLGDDELGVWCALTAPCDAEASRRGLRRHRPGDRLGDAETPLEVWSDGVLPFGLRSAPVGAEAEAVRRFRLIGDGKLGELGMGPQEAALRGVAPNGGVRNLVVNVGTAAPAPAGGLPVVRVARLARLAFDPLTGQAEGELGHATTDDGKVLSAGAFSLDLARALATAARAPQLLRRGAYLGPSWIRLGPVTLT